MKIQRPRLFTKSHRTATLLCAGGLVVLAALSGCVMIGDRADQFRKRFYTVPLWIFDNAQGYEPHKAPAKLMNEDVNVVVCVSGGGARSSYFAACVMEQLAKIPDPSGRKGTVADRVQVMSGVSGGSLAALYYSMYKPGKLDATNADKFFTRYKQMMSMDQIIGGIAHLENNVWEGGLYYYTRWRLSQSLAQMYDRKIFKGATVGQLHRRALAGESPLALVHATNLDTGGKFVFTALSAQDYFTAAPNAVAGTAPNLKTLAKAMDTPVNRPMGFDTIDSEADNFRIAVAASASSGLPMTPGPTTLVNYKTNGYVHLADGGINDNTAMDTPVQLFLNAKSKGKAGKLVILSLDAMQGNSLQKCNDRDPDGYVGTVAYAASAFGAATYRSQVYQRTILSAASPDIKMVRIALYENPDADAILSGRGIGLSVTPADQKIISDAAVKLVAKKAGEIKKVLGGSE